MGPKYTPDPKARIIILANDHEGKPWTYEVPASDDSIANIAAEMYHGDTWSYYQPQTVLRWIEGETFVENISADIARAFVDLLDDVYADNPGHIIPDWAFYFAKAHGVSLPDADEAVFA